MKANAAFTVAITIKLLNIWIMHNKCYKSI